MTTENQAPEGEQAETLRLADCMHEMEKHHLQVAHDADMRPEDTLQWELSIQCSQASAELRRLHAALAAQPAKVASDCAQSRRPSPAEGDCEADFESWWYQSVADNGGASIGADYKHWAFKAWQAAQLNVEPKGTALRELADAALLAAMKDGRHPNAKNNEALGIARQDLFAAIERQASAVHAGKFKVGDRVRKVSGSEWSGLVVGTYSTALTPDGYAVESAAHAGSVQIYPAKALELGAHVPVQPTGGSNG